MTDTELLRQILQQLEVIEEIEDFTTVREKLAQLADTLYGELYARK